MKGKFDAYVLWPLAKRVKNWIVDRSTARNFTVCISTWTLLLDAVTLSCCINRISIVKIVVLCAGGGISNYGDLHPSDMALDTGVVYGMCFHFLFKEL